MSSFMSDLSKSCGLSRVYTNHSVRATGATILSKNMYGAAQIMSVTGHKSVQSLTVYQRVDTEEKIKMGQTLTDNMCTESNLALPAAIGSATNLALPAARGSATNLALPATIGSATNLAFPAARGSATNLALPPARALALAVPSTEGRIFPDYLKDVDLTDILGDFDTLAQFTPATNSLRSNSQIIYGNVTVIHNLTINKS
jgi:hypothetical protein